MDSKLTPIANKSVVDQIIDRITKAIASGKYKTGSKMPSEFELMDELQVSRNSLREAFKILSSMGILEIKRGDGTYVCSQINPSSFDTLVYGMIFDMSSSDELFELRQVLDEAMIKLASKKKTQGDIVMLEENIQSMDKAIKEKDVKLAAQIDYEFHMLVLEISGNVFLSRIAKGIYNLYFASIETLISVEERFSNAVNYHKGILEVIKSGNAVNAENAVLESLSSWKNLLDKSGLESN